MFTNGSRSKMIDYMYNKIKTRFYNVEKKTTENCRITFHLKLKQKIGTESPFVLASA